MKQRLWAIGPRVVRVPPETDKPWASPVTRYLHEEPVLHRVYIREVGGIGEPNAGELLVTTPCGYEGWVRTLNRNPDGLPACEACLNHRQSRWMQVFPKEVLAGHEVNDQEEIQ